MIPAGRFRALAGLRGAYAEQEDHPFAKGTAIKLIVWLRARRLTANQFASRLGVDKSLVSRWLHGAIPQPDHMRAIYLATSGRVGPNDFYDLPRLRRPRPVASSIKGRCEESPARANPRAIRPGRSRAR